MPAFCDVALPVPLDMTFTYRVGASVPCVGARVLVPFRNERLSGVVTALHDTEPSMEAKTVLQALDPEPVLWPELDRQRPAPLREEEEREPVRHGREEMGYVRLGHPFPDLVCQGTCAA